MESFSKEILNEIKHAETESQLAEIIANFISQLESRHFRNENVYFINMVVALQAAKAEKLEDKALKNINIAIELLWQNRRQNSEPLF